MEDATEKLRTQLGIEKTMKIQAVNKLAEIMNRRNMQVKDTKKNKVSSYEMRKKEKECKKLHQELAVVGTRVFIESFHLNLKPQS